MAILAQNDLYYMCQVKEPCSGKNYLCPSSDMRRDRTLDDEQIKAFFKDHNLANLLHKGNTVLEVGCGEGKTLEDMARKYHILPYGIDLQDYSKNGSKVNFTIGNAENLPYADSSFDFIFSFEAMPYVDDSLEAIKEIHRVLKRGKIALVEMYSSGSRWGFTSYNIPLHAIISEFHNSNQLLLEGDIDMVAYDIHYKPVRSRCVRLTIQKKHDKRLTFPRLIEKPNDQHHYRWYDGS